LQLVVAYAQWADPNLAATSKANRPFFALFLDISLMAANVDALWPP
jgi:hypothetical protein